jgi:predicted NBD/HSP70 family sugar kinase
MKVTLADMDGNLIKTLSEFITMPANDSAIFNAVDSLLTKIITSFAISKNQILGMVIGVPGITSETGEGIGFSPGLSWSDTDVVKAFEEHIGVPVVIENDVNLMALGEFHKGLGVKYQNTIYLFAGNGIGSAIILNGEFIRGAHKAAGEIGYMLIGDTLNKKKDMGVFESNYGSTGLLQRMESIGLPVDYSKRAISQLQSFSSQHSTARDLLNELLKNWTIAIVNLASILDPELIILSGDMSDLQNEYLERLIKSIDTYIPKLPLIVLTTLGSKAGLYGAVHLALGEFTQFGSQNRSL